MRDSAATRTPFSRDHFPERRRERIMAFLLDRRTCRIEELVRAFGVSPATIHRDLDALQSQGRVVKVHGGVRAVEDIPTDFTRRLEAQAAEKRLIADAALALIEPGQAVFLDHSSTVAYLARRLAQAPKPVTVITNSPYALMELYRSPELRVIATGGELQYQVCALGGMTVISLLATLAPDRAFVSCAGVDLERGLMTSQLFIAEILRALMGSAREIVLLVDSSKFGRMATFRVAPVSSVHRVITTDAAPAPALEALRASGVEVVAVSSGQGVRT